MLGLFFGRGAGSDTFACSGGGGVLLWEYRDSCLAGWGSLIRFLLGGDWLAEGSPGEHRPFPGGKATSAGGRAVQYSGTEGSGAHMGRTKETTVTALLFRDRLLGSHCHPSPAGCSDSEVSALVSSRAYLG